MNFLLILLLCLSLAEVSRGSGEGMDVAAERAVGHLAAVVAHEWAKGWAEAEIESVLRIEPKVDLAVPTKLPAVWQAQLKAVDGSRGYLMWEVDEAGELIDFGLDADLKVAGVDCKAVRGVPNLQQFALPDGDNGGDIASGCVPTSGASVVAFWMEKEFPDWRGDAGKQPLRNIAKRLRAGMDMMRVPDADGFTDNGMVLAGAMPLELSNTIQADAAAHGVEVKCAIHRFSFERLVEEVDAGRPVLLSCLLRVPQKPELSWGHQVVGVAWANVGGNNFVGVVDNFYPTKHSGAIRWIRPESISVMITVQPVENHGKME